MLDIEDEVNNRDDLNSDITKELKCTKELINLLKKR